MGSLGVRLDVMQQTTRVCPTCDGTGRTDGQTCQTCYGAGHEPADRDNEKPLYIS